MMRPGSNKALSATRFVRLPEVAVGTRGAIDISFMPEDYLQNAKIGSGTGHYFLRVAFAYE